MVWPCGGAGAAVNISKAPFFLSLTKDHHASDLDLHPLQKILNGSRSAFQHRNERTLIYITTNKPTNPTGTISRHPFQP